MPIARSRYVAERGINHIDTAASYGDAELRLGPFLEQHRDEYFLATKTGERTRDAAYAEICRSLERLRTDHVDLIQLHNLVDEDEWRTAYAPGGVLEAAVRARDEGLVSLHRRHRPRRDGRASAHPITGGVRLRLRAAAVQLPDDAQRRVPRRLRGAAGDLRGARGRRADDQVDHPRAVGRSDNRRPAPGTSLSKIKTPSTSRCTGSWVDPGSSSTRSATSTCCRRSSTPPSDSIIGPMIRRWPTWSGPGAWSHCSSRSGRSGGARHGRGEASAVVGAQGRGRQPDRHLVGVVRLLHLRHRRRAGVQQVVLPELRAAGRHPAGLHDVRRRFHRPAAGRSGVRALRGQDSAARTCWSSPCC